jgi:tetratricopeptide (TPR) repeat protein
MPALPQRSKTSSRILWWPNLRCLPGIMRKPGWRRRRSVIGAGQQSLARSATTEAAAQLRKGMDVLDGLPDGPGRRQLELDLQLALGDALTAVKGFPAPEVGSTYARARALAEQNDRPEYLGWAFLGQWSFHRNRGEYKLALALAEQMEKIGEAHKNVRAWTRYASGFTHLHLGDLVAARALLEHCLADPALRSGELALRYNARVPFLDLGVSWLHRSSTVAAERGIVRGSPTRAFPTESSFPTA